MRRRGCKFMGDAYYRLSRDAGQRSSPCRCILANLLAELIKTDRILVDKCVVIKTLRNNYID